MNTPLTSSGYASDLAPERFGELRRSDDLLLANDFTVLSAHMEEDGYLYLPGLLNAEKVREVWRVVTDRFAVEELFDLHYSSLDALCPDNVEVKFRPDLTQGNPVLQSLL